MNVPRIMWFLFFAVMASIALMPLATAKPGETESVRTLVGKIYTGKIEIKDDYTLRISSDTEIANVLITELDEAGFRKYGFKKDRSQDGRFWAERKAAIAAAMLAGGPPGAVNGGTGGTAPSSPLFSNMAEVGPFQPVIDAYEKSKKDSAASASPVSSPSNGGNTDTNQPIHLFSQPGGSQADPVTGIVKPVINAAASTLGISGGLPSTPAVPAAPAP